MEPVSHSSIQTNSSNESKSDTKKNRFSKLIDKFLSKKSPLEEKPEPELPHEERRHSSPGISIKRTDTQDFIKSMRVCKTPEKRLSISLEQRLAFEPHSATNSSRKGSSISTPNSEPQNSPASQSSVWSSNDHFPQISEELSLSRIEKGQEKIKNIHQILHEIIPQTTLFKRNKNYILRFKNGLQWKEVKGDPRDFKKESRRIDAIEFILVSILNELERSRETYNYNENTYKTSELRTLLNDNNGVFDIVCETTRLRNLWISVILFEKCFKYKEAFLWLSILIRTENSRNFLLNEIDKNDTKNLKAFFDKTADLFTRYKNLFSLLQKNNENLAAVEYIVDQTLKKGQMHPDSLPPNVTNLDKIKAYLDTKAFGNAIDLILNSFDESLKTHLDSIQSMFIQLITRGQSYLDVLAKGKETEEITLLRQSLTLFLNEENKNWEHEACTLIHALANCVDPKLRLKFT